MSSRTKSMQQRSEGMEKPEIGWLLPVRVITRILAAAHRPALQNYSSTPTMGALYQQACANAVAQAQQSV
jgi:hypothetical protein